MADILVTAKIHPDLDGVACSLAYADLLTRTGTDADGRLFGTAQSEVSYFIDNLKISLSYETSEFDGGWQKFILVDASSMLGMPKAVRQSDVIEIVDHREGEPEKEFPRAIIQNEMVGAAATLITEKFIKAFFNPKPDHAKLLYGAIYHNTLNFSSPNTHQRDRDAFAWLEKFAGCNSRLTDEMFQYATHKILTDIPAALRQDAKKFNAGDMVVGAYQLIVQNVDPRNYSEQIASGVGVLDAEYKCPVSFLNVSDIGTKISYFYVAGPESQKMITELFEAKFTNNWAEVPLILRKQIMPRVRDYIISRKI